MGHRDWIRLCDWEQGTAIAVEVLKPHGSTNWRALLFGGMTGSFAGRSSLGHRPVLFFRPDLDYLGYGDFVDPRCRGLETAATLPAMIMPALPKNFHFATTFGEEWRGFWNGLWERARRSITNADEIVLIGYSMPVVDQRARAMLLGNPNKSVRLSICCGKSTSSLEQEFRGRGFSRLQSVPSTFGDFLKDTVPRDHNAKGASTSTRKSCLCSTKALTRLNALVGKQGLLKIRFSGEVGFTFLSVDPAPDLPTETDDETIQFAITRSHFLVRFDDGILIDGSEERVISGRHISLIRGSY